MVDLLMYEKDMASVLFSLGEKHAWKFTLVLESVELLILFAVLVGVKSSEGKELVFELVITVWYVGFVYHLLDGSKL